MASEKYLKYLNYLKLPLSKASPQAEIGGTLIRLVNIIHLGKKICILGNLVLQPGFQAKMIGVIAIYRQLQLVAHIQAQTSFAINNSGSRPQAAIVHTAL